MPTLPSGLPEEIAETEDLARFLTQSSHFTATMAAPAVFLPSPKSRETSVARHSREPAHQLWAIALAAAGTRKLYGAGIFKAAAVKSAKLQVAADEPPDRHAVIRGWPWSETDPDLQKAQQKECALVLASAAGPPVLR
jgi:hypothetical protein